MPSSDDPGSIQKTLGALGAAFALLMAPPVFERLFAPAGLLSSDRAFLWPAAAAMLLSAFLVTRSRSARFGKALPVYLGFLALASVEMSDLADDPFANIQEVDPCRRNSRTIIDLALIDGIVDLVHIDDAGRVLKARSIGDRILDHLHAQGSPE